MKLTINPGILDAARLTRGGELARATALIQRALGGRAARLDDDAASQFAKPRHGAAAGVKPLADRAGLLGRIFADGAKGPGVRDAPAAENGAAFITRQFAGPAGGRSYKLYVPSGYHGQKVPLIVMLHGCTQSPDDFAAGTGMNDAAEAACCLVAYPAQPPSANAQRCWNWFREGDQRRDSGEPAILAGLTQAIMAEYAIDPTRVYLAGLSAGGAAAAVMAQTYSDLYAAVGVHSGLACGAARNMVSAMAAMQHGSAGAAGGARVPTIVFHGDRDATVHPRNGDAVVAQAGGGAGSVQRGVADGGHGYSRTVSGDGAVEQWVVHGAGHAWSGGRSGGTYTDGRGPDATAEMMRFFLAHPLRRG